MNDPDKIGMPPAHRALATLALALLALAGNYLSLPLFFGVSFIFGSIMVMVAVRFLGIVPAVIVAFTGGLYTLALWGHPYALIVFSLEGLAVGLLYRRGLRNLVLADLIFWLALGIPLILVFYRGFIGMGWESTFLIALKQPLNGIFNALLAGLVILAAQLYWRGDEQISLGQAKLPSLLFHVLLTAILIAGALPLIINGYSQRVQLESFVADRMSDRAGDIAANLLDKPAHEWSAQLAKVPKFYEIGLALLSSDDETLVQRGEVASLSERPGDLSALENGLSIWLPGGDIPTMPRWKQGRYQVTKRLSGANQTVELVMEQPATPLVRQLEQHGLRMFSLLAGLLAFGILTARFLSQWLTNPLSKLEHMSEDLSTEIARGHQPQIPHSPIAEYDGLGNSLREMSALLAGRVRELRDFNAALFSSAGAVMAVIDRQGTVVRFNRAAEVATGYRAEDIEGKPVWDYLVPPEERADVESVFNNLTGGSVIPRYENQWLMRDGTRRLYDWSNSVLTDTQGEVEFIVTVGVDITEAKQSEQALQQFKSVLDQTLDCVFMFDVESMRFFYTNEGAIQQVGYSQDELLSMHPWDIKPEIDESRFRELLSPVLTGKQASLAFETIHQHKNGQRRPVEIVVQLLVPEGGAAHFVAIVRDISERKRAHMALMEQATHTQAVLDNMVDGIVTINANGIMQSTNPAVTQIFGYDPGELLGRNVNMLMPSPHREAHDRYLQDYQSTGVARVIGYNREFEGQRKDGNRFPIELAVSEITQNGKTLFVGMVRDISERKRIERLQSEFVSTVSHELRTPLTSISGALGLVVGGRLGELPEEVEKMIHIAQTNSQRLSNLINDLLDIEKITAGKLQFDMQEQPLLPIIEHAIENHQTFSWEQNVALVLNNNSIDVEVRVDSQRLQQVLANLLSNAIKFSPKGGAVSISLNRLPGQVRVMVSDEGPGIPQAFRSRIFEKFSQADSSDTRQKGGTGLGLAITRELVEQMGGRVGFDSVEGNGATFWFELPLIDVRQSDPDLPYQAADGLKEPRILIVEDEPHVAEVLARMFTRSGYSVDRAETGQKALEALSETRYDAVSLDLMLPDVSGLNLIRELRQQPQTADLPIMVLSAKMEEGRLAINGDFTNIEWLAKPTDEHRILNSLKRLIGEPEYSKVRVLHVEDDSEVHQVIRAMAGPRFDFELETSLSNARNRISLERFDVIILDIALPDGSGWTLLPEIRERQPNARVLILSGSELTADEACMVESVLLKSRISPDDLLKALNQRIHRKYERH